MRGYLLWEKHGCILRLTQWDWIRMKCTTNQYINSLRAVCESLREIIAILGPIRVDSVEGGNGLKVGHLPSAASGFQLFVHLFFLVGRKGDKPFVVQCWAKNALEELEEQLHRLEKQTKYRDTVFILRDVRNNSKFNRRSIAL